MYKISRPRAGFTLVELMIVVAIIGILAAIAIPNFVAMQRRAKRAELPMNVQGIKTAEVAYEAAQDVYVEVAEYQPTSADGSLQAWAEGSDFDRLGWRPDGEVRGQYKVVIDVTCTLRLYPPPPTLTCTVGIGFAAYAIMDLDQDGETAEYIATDLENASMLSEYDVY